MHANRTTTKSKVKGDARLAQTPLIIVQCAANPPSMTLSLAPNVKSPTTTETIPVLTVTTLSTIA